MLEIKNIYKSYNNLSVLQGIDLEVKTGTIQALLGANGAGKSTLIHIISGLLEADKGKVIIDNEQITTENYKYKSKIGYVFETPVYIDNFTLKDFLHFASKMYKIEKNISTQRIQELSDFFNLPLQKKIYTFSKGMKSKVSLATALIHNPDYLILDEPFAGLDFISIQKISALFKSMAKSGSVIFITSHQYDVISEVSDYFALLLDGKIVFNKTIKQLELTSKKYSGDPNPIKSFLENLMDNDKRKTISWLSQL